MQTGIRKEVLTERLSLVVRYCENWREHKRPINGRTGPWPEMSYHLCVCATTHKLRYTSKELKMTAAVMRVVRFDRYGGRNVL